ncbi:MAG: tRNA-dihydrouridine synthase family protein [Planctomycetes bacterium]|nr:tRNA-dihydrouridine synthase family protein [Planctomycetota bacterium]
MPTSLPFTSPWLLAPMEGVTETCFRDVILSRLSPGELGGAYTEFVRVSSLPIPEWKLAEHLGKKRFGQPVGLQLMGSQEGPLAASADAAIYAGAPLVDLNFGCPAKGVFKDCAGSALLDHPERIEKFVRACVTAAAGRVPVTAKMRCGVRDDTRLEENAQAMEAGGAVMITVHCRTREEGYRDCADWGRVARAVAAVKVPVCGNGSIETHADLERMRRETGCAYAMVGRAALGNPWIFSGYEATAADAARFLLDYAQALLTRKGYHHHGASGRIKQLLFFWTAGGLFEGADEKARKAEKARRLSEKSPESLFAWLEERARSGSAHPAERAAVPSLA